MKKKISKIIISTIIALTFFISGEFALAKTAHSIKKVSVKENFITIQVLDNTYQASYKDGQSLYEVMKNLADKKNSNFSFHSKNYSGLGNFIDEINGIKGTKGRYWIYYINNKKASVGVSKYFVKNGDIIKWSQEGI
jgi:hypothetical protein